MCDACIEWGGRRWHRYGDRYYERTDKSVTPKRTINLHRVVWESAHGPIPAGHDIHHVNGDRLDNRIENLECIPHGAHRAHHRETEPHPTAGLRRACDKPHVCAGCGAGFMRRTHKPGSFCKPCLTRAAEERRPKPERACGHCGVAFRSRTGNFCSQRCVNLATSGATVRVLPEGRRRA